MKKVVILGGGNAGLQTADSLRRGGFQGGIHMICEEAHLPYQRPPLSKKFLEGQLDQQRLYLRPESFFEKKDITVKLNTAALSLDRETKTVALSSGEELTYDKLVFATGARVRPLPGAADRLGLLYLRTLDDVDTIKTRIIEKSTVALIGGGFIGLETAATLTTLGHSVTVIEAMPSIMPGLVGPDVASIFRETHLENGTNLIEGTAVKSVKRQNETYELTLTDGCRLLVDHVVVGIGVIPNTEVAEAAGIAVDHGILVDEFGTTNDADIMAVGDCAHGVNTWCHGRSRLESVQNANDQATIVAKSILGSPEPYSAVPWFWSDQYDLKLQMVGLSRGHDAAHIRGDADARKFSVGYYRNDALIAVDSVNMVADHMAARRLLLARTDVPPTVFTDSETPLKALL